MLLGPSGHARDSQNQLFLFSDTHNYFQEFKENPEPFLQGMCSGNPQILEIDNFMSLGKDVARQIPKIRLFVPEILDMRSISIENMKLKFGHVGSVSFQKHEMEIRY